MIPNQWYAVLESNEVKKGKPLGVTRMGERLVFWRDESGSVVCLRDTCPHRGAALSAGKLLENAIQCPFHGFEFDREGQCRCVPAIGRQNSPPKALQAKAYPAREAHNLIYIWWGEPQETYPELPWFDSIQDEKLAFTTQREHWQTHYSRAIENQLDVVHLPFVHASTIGRGNRTLVNGPLVKIEHKPGGSDILNIWVFNEFDRGQKPLSASEIPYPARTPSLQFRFPNLWQNWLGENFRIFIAFAPIDNENTLIYLRSYQQDLHFPPLQAVVNLFSRLGNKVIIRQDQRVVLTQRPLRTHLHMGEVLIQGDGPIIEYRRRREALITATGGREP